MAERVRAQRGRAAWAADTGGRARQRSARPRLRAAPSCLSFAPRRLTRLRTWAAAEAAPAG